MIEADSKVIWNLPFFVPLPEPSHFSSTLQNFRISGTCQYLIIVIFMEQPRVFHHKSFFFHN